MSETTYKSLSGTKCVYPGLPQSQTRLLIVSGLPLCEKRLWVLDMLKQNPQSDCLDPSDKPGSPMILFALAASIFRLGLEAILRRANIYFRIREHGREVIDHHQKKTWQ